MLKIININNLKRLNRLLLIYIVLTIVLIIPGKINAAVHVVDPGQYATISAFIQANTINPGDTIQIMPGIYEEQLDLTSCVNGTAGNYTTFEAIGDRPVIIDGGNVRDFCIRFQNCKFIKVKGYISFDDNGKIIKSKAIKQNKRSIITTFLKNCNNSIQPLLNKKIKKYLKLHREKILKQQQQ